MGDFGYALRELKRGHRIRRQPWPHDSWLQLARRTADGKDVIVQCVDGQPALFTLSLFIDLSADLLAEDWQVDYQPTEHKHQWSTLRTGGALNEMACDVIGCKERIAVLPGAVVCTSADPLSHWRLRPDGTWVDEDHDGHCASWEYLTGEHTLHLVEQGKMEAEDE